jgi:hypothetical protein
MDIRFIPDRPGNWLFHCHLALHVDGMSTLANMLNRRSIEDMEREHTNMNHGLHEMAGLIIGIHVLPRGNLARVSNREPQRLRLLIQSSPYGYNRNTAMGFVLQQGAEPKNDSVTLPGPTLFLERGRPARITVVNRLNAATSIHWHGLEIDSYPDGVAGWSGSPGRIAPAIQPADSFVAEFTPPRAGTFMYHAHVNELLQTNSGMYGVHIIQIHPQAVVVFRLGGDSTIAKWTPVAKDGADLPTEQSTPRPAYVMMGAGENGEFLYTPERPGLQKLTINTQLAGWYVPVMIFVRPAKKLAAN